MVGVDASSLSLDSPLLLIAAAVVAALLVFGIARKITKLIVVSILLGVVVVGLYLARAQGLITW